MKIGRVLAFAASLLALTPAPALAEDAVGSYRIDSVMARPDFTSQTQGVSFYFGDAPHPGVERRIEENITTSVRTRKFGRSNEEACQWVMMSALLELRSHAQAVGGNALVNIRSNWRNVETTSRTEYRCAAGFLMAGVALKADVVSLR